jgi:hypothetical protein
LSAVASLQWSGLKRYLDVKKRLEAFSMWK